MRRLTLMMVGSMVMAGTGIFALACSSSPTQLPGDDDDDDDTPNSSSSGGGSSSGDNSSGGGGSSSGGSSGSQGCTAKLRPDPAKGVFCPFIPRPDDDRTGVACETGETCCSGRPKVGQDAGFDPSSCVQGTVDDCPDPSNPEQQKEAYECAETDDCPTGNVCCIIPDPRKPDAGMNPNGVGNFQCPSVFGEYGTRCKAECAPNDLQGCQSNGDCTDGQTCQQRNVGPNDRIQMGFCQ